MSKEWKERIEKLVIGTVSSIITILLAALLKGESLQGLITGKTLLRVLNFGVPLWLFLIVMVVALLGALRWFRFQWREIVHVQWKVEQCLWTIAHTGEERWMQVMLSGFITNSHPDLELIITSVYLEGTRPAMSLFETISLPAAHVCDERVNVMIESVLLEEGATFRGNVIFVDQFQRKHKAYIELKGHKPQAQASPEAAKSGN